jgi:hypothetical protein
VRLIAGRGSEVVIIFIHFSQSFEEIPQVLVEELDQRLPMTDKYDE